jgi:hypothetical protein
MILLPVAHGVPHKREGDGVKFLRSRPLDALTPVRDSLRAAEVAPPPAPWHPTIDRPVGGLLAVGFDRRSEALLVVSTSGQSVLDAVTGDLVHRDREAQGYDIAALKAERRDHPADERFDMAGLHGGGLPTTTQDGWTVARLAIDWPETCALLHPPGASIFALRTAPAAPERDASFTLLSRDPADIHAFGFSWTGQSLVLAHSDRVQVWTRAPLPLTTPA